MIRERVKEIKTPIQTEDQVLVDKNADDGMVRFPSQTSEQLHTFEEQAKLVLNILDSQGIDIYDPARKPGMYLHHGHNSSNKLNQSTIGKILHTSTEKQSSVSSENEKAPDSLINFLRKRGTNK